MTKEEKIAFIILAAGKGTRMKSNRFKPLHDVAGLPMIKHVIRTAQHFKPDEIAIVVASDMTDLESVVAPHPIIIQKEQNGTGGAVLAAEDYFKNYDGIIVILFADTPLITAESIQKLIETKKSNPEAGLVYSAIQLDDPKTYGRMILDKDGYLEKIIEYKDASEAQRKINLCNGAVVVADGRSLFPWLKKINNKNAQAEYYLTDLPPIAKENGKMSKIALVSPEDMAGVNTRAELAETEKIAQRRLRHFHMINGATLIDPETTYFSYDTKIGQDVTIEPNVYFGTGVTVEDRVIIHAFTHLEGAHLKAGSIVGPFARLRGHTTLEEEAIVGNFVEAKNAHFDKGAKAKHHAYLSDVTIGEKSNIGAGVITCNYDGNNKYQTTIGKYVFVGSDTTLIAPLVLNDGAYIGAGSTITQDVPKDSLSLTRAPQITKQGWAIEFRKRKN